jgi:excisionase family DNA binding protein
MGKPAYVTTATAAQRLGPTPRTIRNWIKSGKLDGQRVGYGWLVSERSVAALERGR